jgi:type IV pilus assembly protein PilN
MSQVNLLPSDLRERQRVRRQTFGVAAAGVVVLLLVAVFFFLQVMRLRDVESDLEAQRAENAQLESDISRLLRFQEVLDQLAARRELLSGILENEVSWSGVLRDVSLVVPSQVWIQDMSGSVTVPTGGTAPEAAEGTQPTGLIGNITFNGVSLDTPGVALWLTRLEDVQGWANAWLSSATKAELAGSEVVNFSTSVDLTADAAVRRGGGGS